MGEIDFSSPTAPGIINDWVSDATNGLITDFIDKISSATVLFMGKIVNPPPVG